MINMLFIFASEFDVIAPIFFFALVLIIIAGIIYSIFQESKRADEWESAAEDMGFSYRVETNAIIARFGGLKAFSQGYNRSTRNAISGEAGGIAVTITDYRYTTGGGKSKKTHHQTLCVLESESLNLPHCYLRRQHFLDALGRMFGGQDIDFNEDPEFSDLFVLQGENEDAVRTVFNQEARGYFVSLKNFLDEKKMRGFTFEAGGSILVVNPGKRIEPEQAQELMGVAFEILKVFK